VEGNDEILENYLIRNDSEFDASIFPPVINGLHLVVEAGTGKMAQVPGLEVCGKTGTAENPHGEDHSVFVAFAPKDNPRIAIAAIVENSGWGGTWSAPICGLMIEKYINREIDPSQKWKEDRILQANFLEIAQRDDEDDEIGEEEDDSQ
jgi:penicillin-binding protein 2